MTTLVHGGMLCGRGLDAEPCKEEDIPTWNNPFTGNEEPNPYTDFMKVCIRGAKNIFVSANLVFLPKIFCQTTGFSTIFLHYIIV